MAKKKKTKGWVDANTKRAAEYLGKPAAQVTNKERVQAKNLFLPEMRLSDMQLALTEGVRRAFAYVPPAGILGDIITAPNTTRHVNCRSVLTPVMRGQQISRALRDLTPQRPIYADIRVDTNVPLETNSADVTPQARRVSAGIEALIDAAIARRGEQGLVTGRWRGNANHIVQAQNADRIMAMDFADIERRVLGNMDIAGIQVRTYQSFYGGEDAFMFHADNPQGGVKVNLDNRPQPFADTSKPKRKIDLGD